MKTAFARSHLRTQRKQTRRRKPEMHYLQRAADVYTLPGIIVRNADYSASGSKTGVIAVFLGSVCRPLKFTTIRARALLKIDSMAVYRKTGSDRARWCNAEAIPGAVNAPPRCR